MGPIYSKAHALKTLKDSMSRSRSSFVLRSGNAPFAPPKCSTDRQAIRL